MRLRTLLPVLGLVLATVACGGSQGEPPAEAATPSADAPIRDARILDLPDASVPSGHPTVGDDAGAANAGDRVLTWTVPDGWIVEPPQSRMRWAQYRVPGAAGDGVCVVFYFGPGQGGDKLSNARRWAGQFAQPDGRSSEEVMQTSELVGGEVPVLLVEVTGTYNGGMTGSLEPPEPLENHMLLGAVAEGPDANWFFKFTGPVETIREQRSAFEDLLRSLRQGE